jgi:O-antigen ligase
MAFVYCVGEFLNSSDAIRKRYLLKVAIPFAVMLIIGTSATSNIAAFFGISVILVLSKTQKFIIFFSISSALALLYLTGNLESFWIETLFPGKVEREIISLKGRTYLWGTYWELIQKEPFWGYGFGVVSRMGALFGGISTTNAHNGAIEILLNTGLLGGFFMIIWVFRHIREIISSYKFSRNGIIGYISAFTVAMVNNMGRTMIGGAFDVPAIIFIALIGLFLFHIQTTSKNKAFKPAEITFHNLNLS